MCATLCVWKLVQYSSHFKTRILSWFVSWPETFFLNHPDVCEWQVRIRMLALGNKVFMTRADFRTLLWKGHYECAKIVKNFPNDIFESKTRSVLYLFSKMAFKNFFISEHGFISQKDVCNSTLMVFLCVLCFFHNRVLKTAETSSNFSP